MQIIKREDILDDHNNWKVSTLMWEILQRVAVASEIASFNDSIMMVAISEPDLLTRLIMKLSGTPKCFRSNPRTVDNATNCEICNELTMTLTDISGMRHSLCDKCNLYIFEETNKCEVNRMAFIQVYGDFVRIYGSDVYRYFKKTTYRWPNVPHSMLAVCRDKFMSYWLEKYILARWVVDYNLDILSVVVILMVG